MTKVFYSASTGGFYESDINGDKIPPDSVEITSEYRWELVNAQSAEKIITADGSGYPILTAPPPPTQSQIIAQYESALDTHLDSVAKAYRYDDRKSFALRAAYPGPYQAEGLAFAQWMDDCNVQAYSLLQSVTAGETPKPTIEEMIAALPRFVLP